MRDLQKVFWNCATMLTEIGIDYGNIVEVKVNKRATRRWGQCCTTFVGRASNGEPRYIHKINISQILLDDNVPIEALQNTIIHEILHTCPGCNNHGPEWKKRAAIVKKKLGYDIKRCTDASEKQIPDAVINEYRKPKYIVRCKKCGREVGKTRMCSIVEHPSIWRCGICGGNFERLI